MRLFNRFWTITGIAVSIVVFFVVGLLFNHWFREGLSAGQLMLETVGYAIGVAVVMIAETWIHTARVWKKASDADPTA